MTQVDFMNIPQELQSYRQWVLWKSEDRGGKAAKRPYQVNGRLAKSNDSNTWSSYDEVFAAYTKGGYDGIGFVFSKNDPYIGVDLDKVIDKKTKKITPEAQAIIDRLDSYTEYSPSGTGYHIIVKGKLPAGGNRKGFIEMYDDERYFTFTGDILLNENGEPMDRPISERQEEINHIHREYIGPRKQRSANLGGALPQRNELSYQDIMERAGKTKSGRNFQALMAGDYSDYISQSEADLALCNFLAFWTGRDPEKMDSIFRKSGLYREKWDEKRPPGDSTYGKNTIQKAIDGCDRVYEPSTKEKIQKRLKVTKYEKNDDDTKLLVTKQNIEKMLQEFGYHLQYNVMTNTVETPGKKFPNGTDSIVVEVYDKFQRENTTASHKSIEKAVLEIAMEDKVCHFKNYLERCRKVKSDGRELKRVLDSLEYGEHENRTPENPEKIAFYKLLITKFFISIVAMNMIDVSAEVGEKTEGSLILQGPQGIGKTTWFGNLVPEEFFSEGKAFGTDKDSKMEIYKYILVELGEFGRTTRKHDQDVLKNTLTSRHVEYRPPYGSRPIKTARRTAFCGTVNDDTFLVDDTGNRRFWVVPVKSIDYQAIPNQEALWSDIIALYEQGHPWYLTPEERRQLEQLNQDYLALGEIAMLLQSHFDFSAPEEEWDHMEMYEINDIIGRPKGTTPNKIGRELTKMGIGKSAHIWRDGKTRKCRLMPPQRGNPPQRRENPFENNKLTIVNKW